MKKMKVNASFSKYTDAGLDAKAESIVLAFTDNPHLPDPTPPVPVMVDAIGTFRDAIAAAIDGSRIKIAERKAARKVVEDMLRQWAHYVNMKANGDPLIIATCGMDVEKGRTQVELQPVDSVQLASGPNPGEVVVKIRSVKGKLNYLIEYTQDPLTEASVWKGLHYSRSKVVLTGLEIAKLYWVRVTVLGRGSAKAVSKPVSIVVQ